MSELSERQQAILNFIEDCRDRSGAVPAVADIARHFQLAESTVCAHLRALQRRQLIPRPPRSGRRPAAGRAPARLWRLPILGQIPAGEPAETPLCALGECPVPAHFAGLTSADGVFVIRVHGESMRDAGILEGDLAVMAPLTGPPRPGEIVAALLQGGETSLKTYFPGPDGTIELHPANPAYRIRQYPAGDIRLQGRLAALIRLNPVGVRAIPTQN
ncbi:MAG: hypothetical protein IJC73_06105 [Lentisphaeria bacterium]|nr:hypothetical protein [Lentisphaeria bacterium]